MNIKNAQGFTLIELMITIAIAGVLLGIAVPSFMDTMERNRVVNYSNELLGAFTYARNEARNRRTEIRACSSADGTSCDANWAASNPIILIQVSDNTVIRQLSTPPAGLEIAVTAVDYTWDSGTSRLTEVLNTVEGDAISYDSDGQLVSNIQGTHARRLCVRIGNNETPYSLFRSGQIQVHPGAPCPAND